METDLTKRIKALTHHYRPRLHTEKRTVWTPTGIVDCLRFEDYYENEEYLWMLLDAERFSCNHKPIFTGRYSNER